MLAKNSIPVLHSSAAMMKIAEMEYSGANSIFLRLRYYNQEFLFAYNFFQVLKKETPKSIFSFFRI